MKKLSIKSVVALPMILALLFVFSSLAFAQGGARVYLQPVESTDQSLTVDVMVENVTDLYGAEFRLTYDPALLEVQDLNAEQGGLQIQAGTLLPADKGFVVANKVEDNKIIFAMTLLNPAPPVSGNGPLARVKFNLLQNSPATINVEHVKLVASNLQTIPAETSSLTVGNANQTTTAPVASNPPPAPTSGASSFPWWIIAIVVMLLGVLLLGGLILLGGRKSKPSAQTINPQPKPGPAQPVRVRPSAFNQPADLNHRPQQSRQ